METPLLLMPSEKQDGLSEMRGDGFIEGVHCTYRRRRMK